MRKLCLLLLAVVALLTAGGTYAVPGTDLNALYQAAQPGDVINIDPGSYPAQEILLDPDKVGSFAPVTFKAQGAATFASLRLGANKVDGPDNIVFEDFKVNGTSWVQNSDDITLRNHKTGTAQFQGNDRLRWLGGEAGPWVNGVVNFFGSCTGTVPTTCLNNDASTDNLVDGVFFHDFTISSPEPHSECLQTGALGGKNWRLTIKNSTFVNCTDFAMLLQGNLVDSVFENNVTDIPMPGSVATSQCVGAPAVLTSRASWTHSNTCARGGSSIRVDERGGLNGVKLLYNSALGGISVDNGTPQPLNVEQRGNIGQKNSGSFFCGTGFVYSHNIWQTNSCSPTDLSASFSDVFVDAAYGDGSADLSLKAGSPALDSAGSPFPAADIFGTTRPQGSGPDRGAHEKIVVLPVESAPVLSMAGFDEDTVSVSWDPIANADGYRLYLDGNLVGSTTSTSADFTVAWGKHVLGVEAFSAINSLTGELTVESLWRVTP
jgi:hypothetical protein